MAKLYKSHNSNTDKRTALLVGIFLCAFACAAFLFFKLWMAAAVSAVAGVAAFFAFYNRIKVLQSGLDGENKTAKMLVKRLPRGCAVCQNFTVKCGPTAELDAIAITPQGVSVIEVKNQAGEITGRADAQYWRHTRSGKRGSVIEKQMPNALVQSSRQVQVIKNVLIKAGINAPLKGCVYFSNSYISVNVSGANVFTNEGALLAFIQKGRAVLSPQDIKQIAAEIKTHTIK